MPSISQQDYIYIDVPALEEVVDLSEETKKQLYRCAKNGTLADVVLREVRNGSTDTSRVLEYILSDEGLGLTFFSRADDEIVQWAISVPDSENNEAA